MGLDLPPGKRCAVCLSFDFDGYSLWFGTLKDFSPHAVGRGEFAGRVGAERVLEALRRYGIRSTWFIPGHTAETWPALSREVVERGHEIGHHGYCHEDPADLDREEEEAVLVRGIDALVGITGKRPVGYRSPAWNTSRNTTELLVKHGFEYAANGMADDFRPYRARTGDEASATAPFRYGRETELVEVPSAWYLSDLVLLEPVYQYPNRIAPAPTEVERIWTEEFDYMYENVPHGVLTLALHPEGIGRGHRLRMLERVVNHMLRNDDVWFTAMIDIVRSWTPDPPGLWAES